MKSYEQIMNALRLHYSDKDEEMDNESIFEIIGQEHEPILTIATALDKYISERGRNKWESEVIEAARKWINCKGRYHSEQNVTALIELFKREPKK